MNILATKLTIYSISLFLIGVIAILRNFTEGKLIFILAVIMALFSLYLSWRIKQDKPGGREMTLGILGIFGVALCLQSLVNTYRYVSTSSIPFFDVLIISILFLLTLQVWFICLKTKP